MKKLTFLVFIGLITLASCNKHHETPQGEFASGVFVVDEGNFGSTNGEISFYVPETGISTTDVYGLKNGGFKLGDVIQSLTIHEDKAYIVANNSNKVEVVNANTFISDYTVANLSLPRYFTVFNGKGYVTEWVSFTDPGRISVLNLETHLIETSIPSDYGTENIIAANNELYVSNNFSNTVFVIDPSINEVIDTVTVGWSPGEFVVDKDNNLWVICGGAYQENDGALYKINTTTHEIGATIELNQNVPPRLVINKAKDKLVYFNNTHVYSVGIASTTASATPFITEDSAIGFYGIGIDPDSDIIYVGDAMGFTASGVVYRYSSTGSKIDTFNSGIAPNGFVFR